MRREKKRQKGREKENKITRCKVGHLKEETGVVMGKAERCVASMKLSNKEQEGRRKRAGKNGDSLGGDIN